MNEITRIHLGRQPFTIAVDAHKQLRDYLDAIKEAVGKSHKEVIKEIELRMAELLMERGINEEKTILAEDVTFLKEQLGKPTDFKGDDSTDEKTDKTAEPDESGQKRLFRDEKTGMIAGVCSGLAAFFNIDTVIVRLIFIVLTLVWGWGALLYIILWIVVPAAKNSSDRLQMRGKAVTVDNLSKIVNREVSAAATRASKASGAVTQLVNTTFRVIFAIFGGIIVTAAIAAMCAVWAGTGYALRNHDGLIQELVSFPADTKEMILLLSVFVISSLVLFWISLTGMAMINRKWSLPGWVTASTVGLFLIALVGGSIVAPDAVSQVKNRYDDARQTAQRTVAPFKDVSVEGGATLQYKQSDSYKVEVKYFSKAKPTELKTSVSQDGTLAVDTSELAKTGCKDFCISFGGYPEVTVYAPNY
jgi:phage shock protein PspC (stress-responsive transcriptional regulator)